MKLQIRLFAAARQLAQRELLEVECHEGATLAEVRDAVRTTCPALDPLLTHIRFAVNARYAPDQQVVAPSDQIACIPPVSGG
jgi:molybdopterin converting factor small subunit